MALKYEITGIQFEVVFANTSYNLITSVLMKLNNALVIIGPI